MWRTVMMILAAMAIAITNAHGSDHDAPKQALSAMPKGNAAYNRLVQQMLANASEEQLRGFRLHDNVGISLHATWFMFVENSSHAGGSPQHLSLGLQRWLGFMEGRLSVSPPMQWVKVIEAGELGRSVDHNGVSRRSHPLFFPETTRNGLDLPNDARQEASSHDWEAQIREDDQEDHIWMRDELMLDAGVQANRRGSMLSLQSDSLGSLSLDLRRMKHTHLSDCGWITNGRCAWHQASGVSLVALYSQGGGPYNVIAIRNGGTEPIWTTEVFGCGPLFGGGGAVGKDHSVHLVTSEGMLYVFGQSHSAVYLEMFSLADGRPVAKFSSDRLRYGVE